MAADLMTIGIGSLQQRHIGVRRGALAEKCDLDSPLLQTVQQPAGMGWRRSVVKGNGNQFATLYGVSLERNQAHEQDNSHQQR